MIIYHEYGLHENTTSSGDHVERLKAHIANLLSGLGNFSNGRSDANVSSCVLSNANCIQFHREIQFHLAMIHASILSPTFFFGTSWHTFLVQEFPEQFKSFTHEAVAYGYDGKTCFLSSISHACLTVYLDPDLS